jgi:tRNA dimethylallyltransferase
MPARLVVLVGATAAGKSDLAVALAQVLAGEVVNADSMQLYRGMDIGTAKLSLAERQGVPHHLLDVLDVTETATVAAYQERARAVIRDVLRRGRVPILVGGSGLYIRAVIDPLDFPGTDPAVRAELESELTAVGAARLHERLGRMDPVAAAAIGPANGRRIVRALEVRALTGGAYAARLPDHADLPDVTMIGLEVPRDQLYARIATRVDRMWAAGLVDEVRALEHAGLREGRTASRALGYRQVLQLLAGELDEPTARDQTVSATRRFGRRQAQWFRPDPRVAWLPYDDPRLVEIALEQVRRAHD